MMRSTCPHGSSLSGRHSKYLRQFASRASQNLFGSMVMPNRTAASSMSLWNSGCRPRPVDAPPKIIRRCFPVIRGRQDHRHRPLAMLNYRLHVVAERDETGAPSHRAVRWARSAGLDEPTPNPSGDLKIPITSKTPDCESSKYADRAQVPVQ